MKKQVKNIERLVNGILKLDQEHGTEIFGLFDYKVPDFFSDLWKHENTVKDFFKKSEEKINNIAFDFLDMQYQCYLMDRDYVGIEKKDIKNFGRTSSMYFEFETYEVPIDSRKEFTRSNENSFCDYLMETFETWDFIEALQAFKNYKYKKDLLYFYTEKGYRDTKNILFQVENDLVVIKERMLDILRKRVYIDRFKKYITTYSFLENEAIFSNIEYLLSCKRYCFEFDDIEETENIKIEKVEKIGKKYYKIYYSILTEEKETEDLVYRLKKHGTKILKMDSEKAFLELKMKNKEVK